jgi:hypothetical protein
MAPPPPVLAGQGPQGDVDMTDGQEKHPKRMRVVGNPYGIALSQRY